MSITARYIKYILNFKSPSGTSRGILKTKETWFIILQLNDKIGIGETGLFINLGFIFFCVLFVMCFFYW